MSSVIEHSDLLEVFSRVVEVTQEEVSYKEGSRRKFVYLLALNCKQCAIREPDAVSLILEHFNFSERKVRLLISTAYRRKLPFGELLHQLPNWNAAEEKNKSADSKLFSTPCIPNSVYTQLPKILRSGSDQFKHPREKDLFLTGALTILSGCMDSIRGTYDQRTVYPNLFSFIVAPAASGKGVLNFARELGMSLHRKILKESKDNLRHYQAKLKEAKEAKKENTFDSVSLTTGLPSKPKSKVLFIPANSSSAAVIGHLDQSDGSGIIFETEADTMGNSFKQDWGGYSDLLRKAFHHEPITYSRKMNEEYIEVENPRVSVALSGTPSQVTGLISSAEDGLLSRFTFYTFKVRPEWRDVSPKNSINLTDFFNALSKEVEDLSKFLEDHPSQFHLTPSQWELLNQKFNFWLHYETSFGEVDSSSTLKRLALILFRIAMVLSGVRKYEQRYESKDITCTDEDFQTACQLVEVYREHALVMLSTLPTAEEATLDKNKKLFYDALPTGKDFTRKEAVEIGKSINIKERTVGKYLQSFIGGLIDQPIKYGPYRKKE